MRNSHGHFRLDVVSLSMDSPDVDSPLDEDTLKAHLALDGSALDDLVLNLYVPAAITWAENAMHRSIMAREHRWVLRNFPTYYDNYEIRLPRGKTITVNDITYVLNRQTLVMHGASSGSPGGFDYQEALDSDQGGRLRPLQNRCWPCADRDAINPVVISFRAGYEDPVDVPAPIKHAIMFCVDDMLEIRGATDTATLQSIASTGRTFEAREALLSPYSIKTIY